MWLFGICSKASRIMILVDFKARKKHDIEKLKRLIVAWIINHYRPHTTIKNVRNMKSISQAKLPYFEEIFKIWTHEQQELPFLQIFTSFAYQNLAVLCVKRPWNEFRFSWKLWCCMRSICSKGVKVALSNGLSFPECIKNNCFIGLWSTSDSYHWRNVHFTVLPFRIWR